MRHDDQTTRGRARPHLALRAALRWLVWVGAASLVVALCWGGWRELSSRGFDETVSIEQVSLKAPAEARAEQRPAPLITLRATRGAQAQLPALRSMLSESVLSVERRFGLPLSEPLTITLCDQPESMRQLAQTEQGWAPPEWANGLAYPHKRVIYLHRDHQAGLKRTLEHELAHIALAELKTLPLWLNEGLAVWASERVSFERMKTLAQARLTGELIPISSLSRRFPASPTLAQLAYAQSAHFVTNLADEHGAERLRATLQGLSAGEALDEALEQHMGSDLRSLEARWRSTLTHGRLEGLSSLAQEGVPMAIGLALTLFMALLLGLRRALSAWWRPPQAPAHRPRQRERLIGVKVHGEPREP